MKLLLGSFFIKVEHIVLLKNFELKIIYLHMDLITV